MGWRPLVVVVLASCATHREHTAQLSHPSAVERFVEVLRHGGSLYGLGGDCLAWRAGPKTETSETPNEDDGKSFLGGDVTATAPDTQGRVFGLTYYIVEERPVRLRIAGRGSWSPAEGVLIRDPKNPDFAIIGTASMCVYGVDVHESAADSEAVSVGDDTWFLSRDACLRSRKGLVRLERLWGLEAISTLQPRG